MRHKTFLHFLLIFFTLLAFLAIVIYLVWGFWTAPEQTERNLNDR